MAPAPLQAPADRHLGALGGWGLESQAESEALPALQLEWAEVQMFAQPSCDYWGIEVPGEDIPLTSLVPTSTVSE